jgi:hypothetical protein
MSTYTIKLIYLPDLQHPMALRMRSGAFGSITAGPTLQDGWMLTSITANVDSGAGNIASILSSVASLAGGKAAAGGGGGTSGGTTKKGGGGAAVPGQPSLGPINGFTQEQSDALRNYFSMAINAANKQVVIWGEHVLPPGLYEFQYDTNKILSCVRPVVYFCKDGVNAPDKFPCSKP